MADDGTDRKPDAPSAGAVAAATLLVGAVALPILGLRLLFGGRDAPAEVPPEAAAPGPPPEPAPAPPEPAASEPAAGTPEGPPRRDVEAALARLSDATAEPRRRRARRSPGKTADREASLRPS